MAGILANSASATMVSGDTAVDKAVSGYLNQERIVLTVSPAGTCAWALAAPVDSRATLSADDTASVTLLPDVAGYYTVTVTVGGTTAYVIRIAVLSTVVSVAKEALRLIPRADSQVSAPSAGVSLYYSSTQSALVIKDSAGTVSTVDITGV